MNQTNVDDSNVTEFPSQAGEESEDGGISSMLAQPDPEFLGKLKESADAFEGLKADVRLLNERKAVIIAELESMGIQKDGFRDALKYVSKTEDQQENYDLSYQVTRKALGTPVQMELFDAQIERTH